MAVEWKQHRPVIDLLDEFFCWKSTLWEYFQYVFIRHNVEQKTREKIFNDEGNHLKHLLNNTIIACGCDVEVIPGKLILFDSFLHQRDLVQRVIEVNCRRKKENENVLSRGFSLCRHDSKRKKFHGSFDVQIDCENTTTTYMRSNIWELLCSRIGCDLMLHVLQNMSLFHKMERNNLLQVTGTITDRSNVKDTTHKCSEKFLNFILQLPSVNVLYSPSQRIPQVKAETNVNRDSMKTVKNFPRNAKSFNKKSDDTGSDGKLDTINSLNIPQKEIVKMDSVDASKNKAATFSSQESKLKCKNTRCGVKRQGGALSDSFKDTETANVNQGFLEGKNSYCLKLEIPCVKTEKYLQLNACSKKRKYINVNDKTSAGEPPCKKILLREYPNSGCCNSEYMSFSKVEQGRVGKDSLQRINTWPTQNIGLNKKSSLKECCAVRIKLRLDKKWMKPSSSISAYPALNFGKDNRNEENAANLPMGNTRRQKNGTANRQKHGMRKTKKSTKNGKNRDAYSKVKEYGNESEGDSKLKVDQSEKKSLTILDQVNRKSKVIRFEPVETRIDEKYAFRMHSIMYNTYVREGLHRSHILNNVNASNQGARILALRIFNREVDGVKGATFNPGTEPSQPNQNTSDKKLPRNLRRSLKLLKKLICNYKEMKIPKVLLKYCPSSRDVKMLLQSYRLKKKRKSVVHAASLRFNPKLQSMLYEAAYKDHVPPYKVFFFVKGVCDKVIPRDLLQSKANWKTFYKNLRQFFTLGKNEFITLPMIMKGIKVSHCKWAHKSGTRPDHVSTSFSNWQKDCIERVILWIISEFLMPLVKACFYVTESGQHRKRVFYYRRNSWAAIDCVAGDTCFSRNFVEVSKATFDEAKSTGSTFGCGKIRFIPKATKLRPIINMRCARNKSNVPVPKNFQVERLLYVLKLLAKCQPKLLGATVADMDEVNRKLKDLKKKMKESDRDEANLYFVSSDIECCFDSIPHDKLFEVISQAADKDHYIIRKFSATSYVLFKQCLTVTKRVATIDNEIFPVFVKKHLDSKDGNTSNSIITDGVFYAKEQTQFLLNSLRKHIYHCYVRYGSRYYRLIRGIAQGSVISTYLCNIFYGDMERKHFSECINSDECILMRWTDDFLLITSSKGLAETFLDAIKKGFPEYGLSINVRKSKTNLPTNASNPTDLIQRVTDEWFPWCNFLINTRNLQVRLSYDRYLGKSVGDSFSLRLESRPGRRLLTRMMQHIRIQTSAIVIDAELNSRENILTNAYQIFSFVAIKLNYQVVKLPQSGQPNSNPKFFSMVIHCIFKAFYRQYQRSHAKVCSKGASLISKNDMKHVYYAAILHVLNKHKTRYIKLIKLIKPNAVNCKAADIDIAEIKNESKLLDMLR